MVNSITYNNFTFIDAVNRGRAGSVLIILEIILLHSIISIRIKRIFLISLIPIVLLFVTVKPSTLHSAKISVGNKVSVLSPRVGQFISGKGSSGDLSQDKSWLTRQLMIEKSLEIVRKYPFFGVGPLNFTKYIGDLDAFIDDDKYHRLVGRLYNESDLNSTSSHNAYIQIYSDYGLIIFFLVVYILLQSIVKVIGGLLSKEGLGEYDLIHVSVLAMSLHFFVISSFVGTLTFFILGLAQANLAFRKHKILTL